MGVSVSFSGGGKHRSFDLTGVPTGEAATFLGDRKKKAIIPDNIRRAMHPLPVDPTAAEKEGKVKLNAFDMRPDTLDKKTMPGSAVVASMTGLCLEGEQANPVILGTKFYSSHNGKKGFHSISELDPSDSPARVGVLGEGKEGADTAESQEGAPSAFQVSSRLVMEIDDLGRKVLVEYDKDIETTPLGRFSKVTGERRRIVGIVSENKKDKPHPYKVRFSEEFLSWEIYLPTEECFVIGDVPTSVTGNLEPSPAENGWYFLYDIPEDASEIRLNGELGSDSELTLSFSDASNDPANYPNRFSYLIAKVDNRRVTEQNITSAIHRSGRQVWVDPGDGEAA